MEKHSINKRQTDANVKRIFSNGGNSRVGAHFLECLSHNALPKNRKRETLDACNIHTKVTKLMAQIEK